VNVSLFTTVEKGLAIYFVTLGDIASNQNRYQSFDALWVDLVKYAQTTPAGKQNTLHILTAVGGIIIQSPISDVGVKAWS
jgi:hypothetical protein